MPQTGDMFGGLILTVGSSEWRIVGHDRRHILLKSISTGREHIDSIASVERSLQSRVMTCRADSIIRRDKWFRNVKAMRRFAEGETP